MDVIPAKPFVNPGVLPQSVRETRSSNESFTNEERAFVNTVDGFENKSRCYTFNNRYTMCSCHGEGLRVIEHAFDKGKMEDSHRGITFYLRRRTNEGYAGLRKQSTRAKELKNIDSIIEKMVNSSSTVSRSIGSVMVQLQRATKNDYNGTVYTIKSSKTDGVFLEQLAKPQLLGCVDLIVFYMEQQRSPSVILTHHGREVSIWYKLDNSSILDYRIDRNCYFCDTAVFCTMGFTVDDLGKTLETLSTNKGYRVRLRCCTTRVEIITSEDFVVTQAILLTNIPLLIHSVNYYEAIAILLPVFLPLNIAYRRLWGPIQN